MPSDFQRSYRAMATEPYRRMVAGRIEGLAPDAVQAAIARLPDRLQPSAQSYLDAAAEKFLRSRLFWESSTCREALSNVLELAAEVIEDDEVWACHKRPLGEEGALADALFELATVAFAAAAAASPDQRRVMGIKRGWFR